MNSWEKWELCGSSYTLSSNVFTRGFLLMETPATSRAEWSAWMTSVIFSKLHDPTILPGVSFTPGTLREETLGLSWIFQAMNKSWAHSKSARSTQALSPPCAALTDVGCCSHPTSLYFSLSAAASQWDCSPLLFSQRLSS